MEDIQIEATESIKIIKNTKGYNYEIKVRDEKIDDATLIRLDYLNGKLQEKYGDKVEKPFNAK